jgi:arsenate reductase
LGGKGPACLPTTPCFTEVSVTSSAPLKVTADLAEGEEVAYKFFTRNAEIEFSAVFSVDGQPEFGVIPPKLYSASACSNGKNIAGIFQAPMAGKVTFVFKHSGWFARTVLYRLKRVGGNGQALATRTTSEASASAVSKPAVMFVCVHNAARSQMAEGYGKELLLKTGLVRDVQSSGLDPTQPNPSAIKVMSDVGIDISTQKSQHLNTFKPEEFELVVSLCGCGGTLPEAWTSGQDKFQDWDLKDPEGGGDEVFVEIRNQVEERMKDLAAKLTAAQGGDSDALAAAVGNVKV